MSLYGALAENHRHNERIARGVVTTAAGVATVVLGPTANASATAVINPPTGGMRFMTHFQLTVDDNGTAADGVTVTKPAVVTGNINSGNQTIGSITYPAGTVLNINLYVATSSGNPTLVQASVVGKVRFQIWGGLANSLADPEF